MTIARLVAHDRALQALRHRPAARMTATEIAEYHRIEAARDALWRALPRRIANLRHTLAQLEAYAAEIGMGPVERTSHDPAQLDRYALGSNDDRLRP